MDEIEIRLASALLRDLTDAEWDFLEEYRKTEDYKRALSNWQAETTWRISHQRELTDGRNVLSIESWHGMRVTDRVIVEVNQLDRFVERALECAERVRASEQSRRADETQSITTKKPRDGI